MFVPLFLPCLHPDLLLRSIYPTCTPLSLSTPLSCPTRSMTDLSSSTEFPSFRLLLLYFQPDLPQTFALHRFLKGNSEEDGGPAAQNRACGKTRRHNNDPHQHNA
ncbi:hypothetical protein CHARACLAT_016141 [Characodon lateralis]|uniref:Uncharacterized protein n=1 Tax=Characodon lateralis TaxID=208331 RepID=A0ABU7D7A9_9TELE|nr:hypothetical protein [Characodon lateralis]